MTSRSAKPRGLTLALQQLEDQNESSSSHNDSRQQSVADQPRPAASVLSDSSNLPPFASNANLSQNSCGSAGAIPHSFLPGYNTCLPTPISFHPPFEYGPVLSLDSHIVMVLEGEYIVRFNLFILPTSHLIVDVRPRSLRV